MSAQLEEVAHLKQQVEHFRSLLGDEQASHRNFRFEMYRDPEFASIIERRDRERQERHSQEYINLLLGEVEELAFIKDQNNLW